MGNSSTDGYFIEAPSITVAALRKNYTYYWIDPKVHVTQENRAYLQIIKQLVPIVAFDHWEPLSAAVSSLNIANQPKICIISSSSLTPEAYVWMQGQKKISKVVLFCSSRERALPLLQAYPKIYNYFTNLQDVISEIRTLQSQQVQSLHFFCKEEINRLNQWMHNWFALQLGGRQRGKEDFKALINAMSASHDIKRLDRQYNIQKNQGDRQAMVLQWIKANNYFLYVPLEMLAKLRNTFALALIRLPFFDIYNSIKTSYASKNYPDMKVYTRISLNSYQLARIKTGGFKYIYFSTFLICETDPGRKSTYKNQFRVTIMLRQKPNKMEYMDSSGFLFDEDAKRVFLNIDIPFQVLQIDLEKRQMVIELVHVPKCDVQTPAQLARLQLHRKFIRYIGKIIPGQLLPSFHNDQLSLYKKQLQNEIQILHMTTNIDVSNCKCLRKLEMARLNLYYHLENEQAIQKEVLQAKELSKNINIHNNKIGAKIKIYLFLIEINLRKGDFLKFGKCLTRLKAIYQQFSHDFTEEQSNKYKVYGIYCYVATNKTEIRQNLEKVNQIQAAFNNRQRQDAKVSKLYFLIMITKIKCEEILGNISKAYVLFDELLQNIETCQGKNQVYRYYQSLKEELRLRQTRKIIQIQKQQIKKRVISQIDVNQLPTDPLPIKFIIDDSLFGQYDYSQYFD